MLAPVTFILAGDRLVTVRYHEPRAFQNFATRGERIELGCTDGVSALLSLLDVVVDRLADILEKIGRDVEALSRLVFRGGDVAPGHGPDFRGVLRGLGREGDLVARPRQPGDARPDGRVLNLSTPPKAASKERQGAAEDAAARHAGS